MPLRRAWQIRLMTALIAVIAAGVVLGLNLRPPRVLSTKVAEADNHTRWITVKYEVGGWPLGNKTYEAELRAEPGDRRSPEVFAQETLNELQRKQTPIFDLTNFVVAAIIVISIGVLCEIILRKKDWRFH